jgi:hypothetical protein
MPESSDAVLAEPSMPQVLATYERLLAVGPALPPERDIAPTRLTGGAFETYMTFWEAFQAGRAASPPSTYRVDVEGQPTYAVLLRDTSGGQVLRVFGGSGNQLVAATRRTQAELWRVQEDRRDFTQSWGDNGLTLSVSLDLPHCELLED